MERIRDPEDRRRVHIHTIANKQRQRQIADCYKPLMASFDGCMSQLDAEELSTLVRYQEGYNRTVEEMLHSSSQSRK